ncbi:MAG: DUF4390 domain-containing protein [Denitromonas halophila]|uniref:DUF4390 domain-containing protein n=2 Tax=Denitromonas TaxID=139331 RepID=A0A558EFL7_9RHOO|nr:DUF4390 domain-containing protein [Denitromonas ohlonensis]TVO72044.1 DUF4390 domain-containing protein [Denitromonas ohlonensis]TVT51204.1 MAG: DUF4390 domain-containing protein [Denitromonas halophila]TVT71353.1 MAG: DUF4390 domain-containing protein [Denitromonas halophila]TVT72165.1 MAG: DUF4390 domain-containing protein [Denitromonas halophila]
MLNTTAFTTPCSKRRVDLPLLLRAIGLALCLLVLPAQASEAPRIAYGEIQLENADYVINADIELTLNPRVEDAIRHGIAVYFVLEASIESPRWYWLDKSLVSESLSYRLTYHALTRSFRLAIGNFHQSFDSLDAAVRTMTRVRRWRVAGIDTLEPGQSYKVTLRFRLDTDLLPRPFKVSALGSRDWSIDTEEMSWIFLTAGRAAP